MNNLKTSFNILFIIVLALTIGLIAGIYFQRTVWGNQQGGYSRSASDKLQYTMQILEQRYVDPLSHDSLVEMAIPQLLSQLDPHSEYIPVEYSQAANESLAGKFDGIGVMFNMFTDTAVISNVISGGPSSQVGVMPGDKIVTINDTIVAGIKMPSDKVVSRLRGKKGTEVTLGLQRGSNPELISIVVERGEIPINSIEATFMVNDSIGYINISKFAAATYNEFMVAMDRLSAQNMKSVVIDLRNNGGGYLEQAIYMANEFLEKGDGIVYTEGANTARREQFADGRGTYQNIPMVILMGPESASASEIFAGAMQDNDRATIVGLRSFGKGLIQEQFEYPDKSVARITIAHYYTPLGRSIQKPYTPGSKDDYQAELLNRYASAEFLNADSVAHDSTQRFITDQGRVLYGGGGIHPDIFVPIDTTTVNPYFRGLVEGNYIFRYATKYTENNRSALNKVESFEDLEKAVPTTDLLNGFLRWSSNQGAAMPTKSELEKSKSYIISQLMGYIGRNTTLSENAVHYYFYPLDSTFTRGVEYLNQR